MRIIARIVGLLVLLTIVGCATYRAYSGKKLARAEIAVLEVPLTRIVVDGTTVPMQNVNKIELLPGFHRIEWDFSYPNRYRERMELSFQAEAGGRYRLGEKFFAAPHPGGPLGAFLEVLGDTALLPISLFVPGEDPTGPPEGDYYLWIVDRESQQVLAGLAPDVPEAHSTITFVPVEDD